MSVKSIIVAAELPHFIPSFQFFLRMAVADIFVLADNLDFSSRSPVQRMTINIQDHNKWLTVPTHYRQNAQINSTKIDYHENWSEKIWRSIRFAFHQLPFFEEFFPAVHSWLSTDFQSISHLNNTYIEWVRNIWGIDTEIRLMSEIFPEKLDGDPALVLCRRLNGTHYVIDNKNRNFVDSDRMSNAGIKLISMDDYLSYLPLELENNTENSSLELLFEHGPQMSALFSNIKEHIKEHYTGGTQKIKE